MYNHQATMANESKPNFVDISGINKSDLLNNLWDNTGYASFFAIRPGVKKPEKANAIPDKVLENYIYYFRGKAIKTDLSKDKVDPYLYDRDAGQNMFAKIVNLMRMQMHNEASEKKTPTS